MAAASASHGTHTRMNTVTHIKRNAWCGSQVFFLLRNELPAIFTNTRTSYIRENSYFCNNNLNIIRCSFLHWSFICITSFRCNHPLTNFMLCATNCHLHMFDKLACIALQLKVPATLVPPCHSFTTIGVCSVCTSLSMLVQCQKTQSKDSL